MLLGHCYIHPSLTDKVLDYYSNYYKNKDGLKIIHLLKVVCIQNPKDLIL